MQIPRLTVDMMAAVIALAESRNYESAAKKLGLTASAVQKRISSASELMENRLFLHTDEGVRLTEAGEVFYGHALKAMEQVLLIEETTLARAESQGKQLVVGHSTYLPPRLLALLHDRHLGSTLGIELKHKPGLTPELIQGVVTGTLQAGVGCLPGGQSDLIAYPLTEEPILVCMPTEHRLATKAAIRPQDLDGEPIIALGRESVPYLHKQIDEFFLDFGVKLNFIADAFGPSDAVAMTEQRLGLCLLNASNIRTKGSVAVRPLTPRTLSRRIALFVRADSRHPGLKPFVDLVLEKTSVWRGSK